MIPKVCANCANGINIGSSEQIIGTVCNAWCVAKVWKRFDDDCANFVMDENPAVASEPQEAAVEQEAGEVEVTEGVDDEG